MAKVSWPSQEDCKNYAIVVIVATAIVGVMLALWDFALAKALAVLLQVGISG
jgi:preprotein translocase SecE subunit